MSYMTLTDVCLSCDTPMKRTGEQAWNYVCNDCLEEDYKDECIRIKEDHDRFEMEQYIEREAEDSMDDYEEPDYEAWGGPVGYGGEDAYDEYERKAQEHYNLNVYPKKAWLFPILNPKFPCADLIQDEDPFQDQ